MLRAVHRLYLGRRRAEGVRVFTLYICKNQRSWKDAFLFFGIIQSRWKTFYWIRKKNAEPSVASEHSIQTAAAGFRRKAEWFRLAAPCVFLAVIGALICVCSLISVCPFSLFYIVYLFIPLLYVSVLLVVFISARYPRSGIDLTFPNCDIWVCSRYAQMSSCHN